MWIKLWINQKGVEERKRYNMRVQNYIDILLLTLSNKYQFYLMETLTYKKKKKYKNIKLIIYKYKDDNKQKYKELDFKNYIELLNYLKEMV